MHLGSNGTDHYSWIQEVQNLPLEPKIYIRAIIGDISWDRNAIWRKNLDTKPPSYNGRPVMKLKLILHLVNLRFIKLANKSRVRAVKNKYNKIKQKCTECQHSKPTCWKRRGTSAANWGRSDCRTPALSALLFSASSSCPLTSPWETVDQNSSCDGSWTSCYELKIIVIY